MYDLPSRDDVGRVIIDRQVVEERVNPTLVPIDEIDLPSERTA